LFDFFEQAAPKMCEANTVLKVRSFTLADMRLPLKTFRNGVKSERSST
jgi:hypothetical protein